MDIFVLDESMSSRLYLVDDFVSFVWTERYRGFGDFQLVVLPTKNNLANILEERHLTIITSKKIMRIERVLKTEDEDGRETMTVLGRTREAIFEDKVIYPNWVNSTDDNTYIAEGDAATVLLNLVRYVCQNGNGGSASDIIPELASTNQAGLVGSASFSLDPGPIYDEMVKISTEYNFGFRLDYRPGIAKSLLLTLFKGVDRKNVIFSATLDNIAQESYLRDVQGIKNVAYVASHDYSRIVKVFQDGATESTAGLDRKVMWVKTDIDASKYTEPRLTNVLTSRGRAELKKFRKKSLMDGVITDYSNFKYGVDFALGDTIYIMDELRRKTAKVVEQYTWAWDETGFRAYPTFASIE